METRLFQFFLHVCLFSQFVCLVPHFSTCLLPSVYSDTDTLLFFNFVKRYHRNYSTNTECLHRFKLFRSSLKESHKWQKLDKGSAVFGVTFFSDMSDKEFIKRYGSSIDTSGLRRMKMTTRGGRPRSIDWRKHNMVTRVQNQGKCSSCYAFGTIACVESCYASRYHQLIKLSEQQMIDCSTTTNGCRPSYNNGALQYLKVYGLMSAKDYPYTARVGSCYYDPNRVRVHPRTFYTLPTNEETMAKYVAQNGPIGVTLNALPLRGYSSGILYVRRCKPPANHVTILVGYGVGTSRRGRRLPYWIAKNSWGRHFGERGYFRIARNKGMCGINLEPFVAVF